MKKQVICSTVFPLLCILLFFLVLKHRRTALVARSKGKPLHQGNATRKMILIVARMPSGWYNNRKRCLNYINIHGNGKSVRAKVVDEMDSTMGYDSDHDYQSPCPNNIVDASKAVWKALGVPESNWGRMDIYWLILINHFIHGYIYNVKTCG
ncbi:hypothetical protein PVK06_017012 [Gossypium arboreum]|uniref:Uncharacterized protein n=1 Tax=Gossypium arboreum TaxID=29729 RepID=A0ABR0Q2D1_GOSAR|nr:hypothetical protein PVK06_017012 [Gossypium arboreum]